MRGLEELESSVKAAGSTSEETRSTSSVAPHSDPTQRIASVRIFVSSPEDVQKERQIAREAFDNLQKRYSGRLSIEPYLWEEKLFRADAGFQEQIEDAGKFDVVICLLWGRLGHPLRAGSPETGTQREISIALESNRKSQQALDTIASTSECKRSKPHVFLYLRQDFPPIGSGGRAAVSADVNAVENYVAELTLKDGVFAGAFNKYSGIDGFKERFEADMRGLLETFLPTAVAATSLVPVTWTDESPFRGLLHFEFRHAPIFFGRKTEIDTVTKALKERADSGCAFIMVLGASGAGKSSLVHAGVVPSLPEAAGGVDEWRQATMRPSEIGSGDLFDALARCLSADGALPELIESRSLIGLAEELRSDPQRIDLLVLEAVSDVRDALNYERGATRRDRKKPVARLALVVDQLEEVFTDPRLDKQREAFLGAIEKLARCGHVWVIATFRSDFYGECQRSPTLMRLIPRICTCDFPRKEQLTDIIRMPAGVAGLEFGLDRETGQRLDDALRDEASESPSSLPLLEFALQQLFENRLGNLLVFEFYAAMGGVQGSLGRHAEASFQKLPDSAQSRFGEVFSKLAIHSSDTNRTSRQRARKDEVVLDPDSRMLVDKLVEYRLLVTDKDGTGDTAVAVVQVAHEALFERWQRLSAWCSENRKILMGRGAVAEDRQRWIQAGRSPDLLCPPGTRLEAAEDLLRQGLLNVQQADFVRESLLWQSLQIRKGTSARSADLRASAPERRHALLHHACNAEDRQEVVLEAIEQLGQPPADSGSDVLVPLAIGKSSGRVRREAAVSLIKLDHEPYFADIVERVQGPERDAARELLTHLRAASDTIGGGDCFQRKYDELSLRVRAELRLRSWLSRLVRGVPTLLMVLIPTLALSSVTSSLFKAFPGFLNYALAQGKANAFAAMFQGTLATFVWGGIITTCITLYELVFASARDRKSYLRPFGAVISGIFGGVLSSGLVLVVILEVSSSTSVIDQGWALDIKRVEVNSWKAVMDTGRGYLWPYPILGIGLGIGMALMSNGVRASREWRKSLENPSSITGSTVLSKIWELTRWMLRYAWPIPLCLSLAGLFAFYKLRSAPQAVTLDLGTWEWRLLGGRGESRLDWKVSPWGQGLSILFDGATQGLGGFFCLVGMALGLTASRFGMHIEPKRN